MVASVAEKIAVITQRQNDVITKLEEHDHAINGNSVTRSAQEVYELRRKRTK